MVRELCLKTDQMTEEKRPQQQTHSKLMILNMLTGSRPALKETDSVLHVCNIS